MNIIVSDTPNPGPKPKTLSVIPENIPVELQQIPHWVLWRLRPKGGEWTKIPYNAKFARIQEKFAKSNDKDTWSTFELALTQYKRNTRLWDGIGFMMDTDLGIVGIDIDHCITDGHISDRAHQMMAHFGTYSEVSPRGTGIRMFCRGKMPAHKQGVKRKTLEMYANVRFLTVTGHRIGRYDGLAQQQTAQPVIDACLKKFFNVDPHAIKNKVSPQKVADDIPSPTLDDQEIIDRLLLNDATRLLWIADNTACCEIGEKQQGAPDWSRIDQSICNRIAYFTGDAEQIDRIFRQSECYREKWRKRRDYRERTISNAIETRKTSRYVEPVQQDPHWGYVWNANNLRNGGVR